MAQSQATGQAGGTLGVDSSSSASLDGASGSGGVTAEGANQCALDGVDYCELEPWPENQLGPRPGVHTPLLRKRRIHRRPSYKQPSIQDLDSSQEPPFLPAHPRTRLPQPFSLQPEDLQTCGNACDGAAAITCPGAATTIGCECIVVASKVASYLGLAADGPISRCFQVAAYHAILLTLSQADASTNRLGGRDVELEPWHCPCNATYSAPSCCKVDMADFRH
jgi:hypothetical protein